MITQNLKEYNSTKPSVITVGTFDGIHIGHKEIINELCLISKKKKLKSIILSFSPHPKIVLKNSCLLYTSDAADE